MQIVPKGIQENLTFKLYLMLYESCAAYKDLDNSQLPVLHVHIYSISH